MIKSSSSSHSDPRTVPLLSKHPRRLEHCCRFRDLRVTTVHPASLNASRSPGGEGSSDKTRCPGIPVGVSHRLLRSEAFSLAFGLSTTSAFTLAFPLGFFSGSCCFLKLLPRLAVSRILFLWCALPLTSSGRFLGPLTLFTFSFALILGSGVERFDNCAQKTVPRLLDRAGVTPSFGRFFREVRRRLSELQLVNVRRRLIASPVNLTAPLAQLLSLIMSSIMHRTFA